MLQGSAVMPLGCLEPLPSTPSDSLVQAQVLNPLSHSYQLTRASQHITSCQVSSSRAGMQAT